MQFTRRAWSRPFILEVMDKPTVTVNVNDQRDPNAPNRMGPRVGRFLVNGQEAVNVAFGVGGLNISTDMGIKGMPKDFMNFDITFDPEDPEILAWANRNVEHKQEDQQ